jgi:hypothetical protein
LFTGFILFAFVFRDFDARYGFLYAQNVLSVFSFALLSVPLQAVREKNWPALLADFYAFIRVLFFSSLLFLACAAIIYGILNYSNSSQRDVVSITRTVKASCIMVLLSLGSLVLMSKTKVMRPIITALMVCVYILGFTAWIPEILNYSFDSLKHVTISKGEVQGLQLLKKISEKGDLICTNKHSLTNYYAANSISFSYGALSERPVLIEGWAYSGLKRNSTLEKLLSDNEMIFTSQHQAQIRSIIAHYEIKYVLAMPGTTMNVAKMLPDWLKEIPDAGSLKIYDVRN